MYPRLFMYEIMYTLRMISVICCVCVCVCVCVVCVMCVGARVCPLVHLIVCIIMYCNEWGGREADKERRKVNPPK